ncbi:MAG TPA: SWIM zinc finger family protein [Thermomicrobiales bacterium]|jgi:hypothetical protein
MELTAEHVLTLAPDAGVAASGKKLANAHGWHGLGQDSEAIWGEFQGSARYQVRAARSDLTVRCSCPSRKFPCKHGVGLLLLAATNPSALPAATAPEWVTSWLTRRAAGAEQREAKAATQQQSAPLDTGTTTREARPSKTADRRLARVHVGIDALDLWLDDLIRNGLAQVATQPISFWEEQAARLTDAQAPGLAGRLRRMAALPNASPDWPARLLAELGRVALLTHAFRRVDELDPPLREDLRGAIGWALTQQEVLSRGERVDDNWAILGQRVSTEDRLRTQCTWLLGTTTGRFGMILQFAHGSRAFEQQFALGTTISATLAYWPSAWPLRAIIAEQTGEPTPLRAAIAGHRSLAALLDHVADATARQPWLDRFPAVVKEVSFVAPSGGPWLVRDNHGATLPLSGDDHWHALAVAGGGPCDLIGEWDGATLSPLATLVADNYYVLGGGY